MNSQDAAVLILRAKYLNQLRPKPKGIIANRMVENLPHFRNHGESNRKTANFALVKEPNSILGFQN